MKRLLAILFSLALTASISASSFGGMMLRGVGGPSVVAMYQGPGDLVSGGIVYYGFRGYNAAYSDSAANVCLPADACKTHVGLVSQPPL